MAKIYTRTGDDGTTGLFGGGRVSKSEPRIDCYGTVDELSAVIGWAAVAADEPLLEQLRRVQNELFVIGSHLATPQLRNAPSSLPAIDEAMIQRLEQEIDAATSQLPPLSNFILSGGSEAAARLHIARTVCRRAERAVVALSQNAEIAPAIVRYLNRLSDWLFTHARLVNHLGGVVDVPWKP